LDYDIVNPDPAGTITSLRSFGYTVEAAIADLIDNSVAAQARAVDVYFTWDGPASWVAVVDDGTGMETDQLVSAMTVAARGSYDSRADGDLGRFGMGLKSASFSQAERLTVASRSGSGVMSIRTWNLSVVAKTAEWRLLHDADDSTCAVIERLLPEGVRGTVVMWRDLHRFSGIGTAADAQAQQQFYAEVGRVEEHLGMVFTRFLSGSNRVTITVNGSPVPPWDPFLGGHPGVQALQVEQIPVDGHMVRVGAFILPHPRRLENLATKAAGPGGWLERQGFYVYRRNRLILPGDWLGIKGFRRDERYNLARVAVDVPAEADADWAVDVRKSSAVPPVGIRRHLQRIGTAARSRAAEVLSHRGRIAARQHAAEFTYAWNVDRRDGQIRCRINRNHPLVREVLKGGPDVISDTKALVRLLEETIPVAALRLMHEADAADDPEPFLDSAPDEVREVADRIFRALVGQGQTPGEARKRVALMPPFDQYEGFWRQP